MALMRRFPTKFFIPFSKVDETAILAILQKISGDIKEWRPVSDPYPEWKPKESSSQAEFSKSLLNGSKKQTAQGISIPILVASDLTP